LKNLNIPDKDGKQITVNDLFLKRKISEEKTSSQNLEADALTPGRVLAAFTVDVFVMRVAYFQDVNKALEMSHVGSLPWRNPFKEEAISIAKDRNNAYNGKRTKENALPFNQQLFDVQWNIRMNYNRNPVISSLAGHLSDHLTKFDFQ
jgi:hypothetical protein